MRVISLKRLRAFWERHPDAEPALRHWYETALHADWASIQDVRRTSPHADGVVAGRGETLTAFNAGGNELRLVTRIRYDFRLVSVRCILPHAECDPGAWKDGNMATTGKTNHARLPRRFEELVDLMPPRAIADDVHHETMVEMIDRLMAGGRLSKGQTAYLETLIQLVEVYEALHHAIDMARLGGLASLRHLMEESAMSSADLARLLRLHPSMGSKILNGDRSLTLEHVRTLCAHFGVSAELFVR